MARVCTSIASGMLMKHFTSMKYAKVKFSVTSITHTHPYTATCTRTHNRKLFNGVEKVFILVDFFAMIKRRRNSFNFHDPSVKSALL